MYYINIITVFDERMEPDWQIWILPRIIDEYLETGSLRRHSLGRELVEVLHKINTRLFEEKIQEND